MKYNLNFVSYFKKLNLLSILLILISLIFIIFKGLNYGIDFKGGTIIEIRIENKDINVSNIRESLYYSCINFFSIVFKQVFV